MAYDISDEEGVESPNSQVGGLEETLEAKKDRIINVSHCPRGVVAQINKTGTEDALNSLGYELIQTHPMAAYNIFWYTKDDDGRQQVLRERLFESTDPIEQTYVYTALIKHEDKDTIKEFAYAVMEHGNPNLAADAFAYIRDKEGLEKALSKIRETKGPRIARRLMQYYAHIMGGVKGGVKKAIKYASHRKDGPHKLSLDKLN